MSSSSEEDIEMISKKHKKLKKSYAMAFKENRNKEMSKSKKAKIAMNMPSFIDMPSLDDFLMEKEQKPKGNRVGFEMNSHRKNASKETDSTVETFTDEFFGFEYNCLKENLQQLDSNAEKKKKHKDKKSEHKHKPDKKHGHASINLSTLSNKDKNLKKPNSESPKKFASIKHTPESNIGLDMPSIDDVLMELDIPFNSDSFSTETEQKTMDDVYDFEINKLLNDNDHNVPIDQNFDTNKQIISDENSIYNQIIPDMKENVFSNNSIKAPITEMQGSSFINMDNFSGIKDAFPTEVASNFIPKMTNIPTPNATVVNSEQLMNRAKQTLQANACLLQNFQGVPNSLGVGNFQQIQNLPITQNMQGSRNTINMQASRNTTNMHSSQNTKNILGSQNTTNAINKQGSQNTMNMLSSQNTMNKQSSKKTMNAMNLQGSQNTMNMQGSQNTMNKQSCKKTMNAMNMQGSQNTTNKQSSQNTMNAMNLLSAQNIMNAMKNMNLPNKMCLPDSLTKNKTVPHIPIHSQQYSDAANISNMLAAQAIANQKQQLFGNTTTPLQYGNLTAAQVYNIMQTQEALRLNPQNADDLMNPQLLNMHEQQAVEDEEVDYEEIGVADTYAEYWPTKLKSGVAHPDAVVETATLSSVQLPDITYQLMLPEEVQKAGYLSALQLEAVVYACQVHEQFLPNHERAGFLLGDGAGVGKGRTIAAIIYENFLRGRQRSLWISVSNDLKFDAERDFLDICANRLIGVVPMTKFKYSRINSLENDNFDRGVIFCTYTALIGESLTAPPKYKTRLRQLFDWLGKDFDGVIVFDECHKAKNLSLMNPCKSTKTGSTVLELQKLMPRARVVYASATGASEPRNMAYMVRLGLWGNGTIHTEFSEFANSVEKRGVGAMEIVAMDMKLRGTYIARQLSYKNVNFRIEEVPMTREFRKIYNFSADLWAEINKKLQKACQLMCIESREQNIITCQFWCSHQRFFKNLCIASKVHNVVKKTLAAIRMGKAVVIGLQSTGESRTLEHLERHKGKLTGFVSTAKMIIQSFVEKHFPAPSREMFDTLLMTGTFQPEVRAQPKRRRMNADWFDDDMDAEAGESELELYHMEQERKKDGTKRRGRPPKLDKVEKTTMQDRILQHLADNLKTNDNGDSSNHGNENDKSQSANITEHDVDRCIIIRDYLLKKIEQLGRRLPANTLDRLIYELGGTKMVAEMTGRRGRVIKTGADTYKYELRTEEESTMDLVNYREKRRFMDANKHIAIISEAASSGISLQTDKRVPNQRRRLHITLELPWSADRAIQQFGRTHRSNQVNAPDYIFVISDLAGERRFASTVAKRLESLGALTQGDRRASDARDLSQFNIDNCIGRDALKNVMKEITGENDVDYAKIPESYQGDFIADSCKAMVANGMITAHQDDFGEKRYFLEKDSNNVSKFLNRILGCRVELQNALFKFFQDKMFSLIMQMKRTGHFDLGILDLDAHDANVTAIKLLRFTRRHATGRAATELHTVTVERGISYASAVQKCTKEQRFEFEGFYMLKRPRNGNNCAILCLNAQPGYVAADPVNSCNNNTKLRIYRPNTGPQVRKETLGSITKRYEKVKPEVASVIWSNQYDICLKTCSHIYWNRTCPIGPNCGIGLRVRNYNVLSGLMLPIWDRIEQFIEKRGYKIQMVRVKTNGKKIVGMVVPNDVYDQLVTDLAKESLVEEAKL